MRRSFVLLVIFFVALSISAQKISHEFRGISMSKALKQIEASAKDYTVNFIYNELEDFTVTTSVKNRSVTDAIRDIIGFYPIKMTVDGKNIFVECIQKESTKLSGKVIESNGKPISYASVALLSLTDSTMINGGVSNEAGDFVVPCSHQEVLMRISYIGYNTVYCKARVGNVGKVILRPGKYMLKGVTVKGERPLITHEENKTIFHAGEIKNKENLDASDLLRYVPRVMVSPNGEIKLNNRDVTVYVNDRKLRKDELQSYLQGLSATDIERIETQDIHGSEETADTQGGVIHIITRQRIGFSSLLKVQSALYEHGNNNYYPYTTLFWGTERWNIYGSYYYTHSDFMHYKGSQYSETTNDFLFDHTRHVQTSNYKYHSYSHNYTLGGMFYVDAAKRHNIGLEINGDASKRTNHSSGTALFTDSLGNGYNAVSSFDGLNKPHFVNVAASYKWKIDNHNSFLRLLANYNHQNIYKNNYSVADYAMLSSRNVDESNLSKSKFNNLTTNVDFRKDMSHGWSVKAGSEYQMTERKSFVQTISQLNDSASSATNWRYRENIGAGYVGLSKQINKEIFLMASLRVESTREKGYDINTGEQLLTKSFVDWIPYLYFSHKVSDKFMYDITYTTSVYHPAFHELVNYTNRLSDALYDRGNPDLQRERNKEFQLSATYGKHSFTISYLGATHTISEDFQVINGITYRTVRNIGNRSFADGSYSYAGKLFPWWQTNLEIGAGRTHCSPSYNVASKWWCYISSNNDFIIPKIGTFNVYFSKNTGDIFMNTLTEGNWYANASYRQSFLDGKLSLHVGINDIFNTIKTKISIKTPLLNYHFYAKSSSRNVFFSLTYTFSTKSKVRHEQLDNENKIKNRIGG